MSSIDRTWVNRWFWRLDDEDDSDERQLKQRFSFEREPYDLQTAAEMVGQELFSDWDGWEYMENEEVEVWVGRNDGDMVKFSIMTEFVPEFTATEVKSHEPSDS